MSARPIPQKPSINTLASMRRGTHPAAIGLTFSGATTNQLASTGPRTPKPQPRSSSGQRGSVSAIAVSRQVPRIGAREKGGDLGTGEHGGQVAWTGHGRVLCLSRRRLDQ